MKFTTAVIICAAAIMIALFPSRPALGASLSIGGTAWYAWWDLGDKDLNSGKYLPLDVLNKNNVSSAPLYGPTLSASMGKWGLSAVFLSSSHFKFTSSYVDLYDRTKTLSRSHSMFTYDLDTSALYSFTKWFKLFMGLKIQGYNENGNDQTLGAGLYDGGVYRTDYLALGPGLGVGLTMNLVDNLYLLVNASGLYLRGDSEAFSSTAGINKISDDVYYVRYRDHVKLDIAGFNAAVGFSYYVEKASLSIAVGGRYQLNRIYLAQHTIKNNWNISAYDGPFVDTLGMIQDRYLLHRQYRNCYDHYYGVTVSVVYSLNLSPKS